jgi:hypothetical protein
MRALNAFFVDSAVFPFLIIIKEGGQTAKPPAYLYHVENPQGKLIRFVFSAAVGVDPRLLFRCGLRVATAVAGTRAGAVPALNGAAVFDGFV